jgi:hypothetical protein
MVKYLEGATFTRNPVPRRGMLQLAPGQGLHGYGNKISSDYMAHVNGRAYRVYCTCYSNVASYYIVSKGEKLFVRDITL